ncbi:antA/AntB antirepressor family protein [Glaesserella parasuis]|nr:antA/AntB antirepressor family protein [Glaesserella parasuis]
MTNSNLIAVFNGQIANQAIQLANARELYTFLEVKNNFAHWINDRITDYGFIQDEDYIIVHERTNGRPRKEYHITLDMGKELAMVERNEKGRQIRKYFIECERRANLQNEQQIAPLAVQDQDLLSLLVKSYHFLQQANELRNKVAPTYIASDIDLNIGGHYLYNLNGPTENALTKARKYVHAKSERIMFVKGMLSLLEEPKQIARF